MAIAFLVGGGGGGAPPSYVEYVERAFTANTDGYVDVADPQNRAMRKARISVNVPQPPEYAGGNTITVSSPSDRTIYVGGKQCADDIVVQLDATTKRNLTGDTASDCIASGVTILGILGTYRGSTASSIQTDKRVTLGASAPVNPILPDSGYTCMDKVIPMVDTTAVNGAYILSGHSILGIPGTYNVKATAQETMLSKNGVTVTPPSGYNAFSQVTVVLSTADKSDLVAENILYNHSILGVTGSHRDQDSVSSTLTSRDQRLEVTPSSGYAAMKKVFVSLSDTDKAKLIPGNIKSGEVILGVTGTYEGGSSISAEDNRPYTVSTYTAPITILPSDTSLYDAMKRVTLTINAEAKVIPSSTPYTTFGTHTINPTVTNGLMSSAAFTISGEDIVYPENAPLAPGHHTIKLNGGNGIIKSVDFWVAASPSSSFTVDTSGVLYGSYVGDASIQIKGSSVGKLVPQEHATMPETITVTGAQYNFYPNGREATNDLTALEPGTIEIFNVYDDVVIQAVCIMPVWSPATISADGDTLSVMGVGGVTQYKIYDSIGGSEDTLVGYYDTAGEWHPANEQPDEITEE